MDQFLNRLTAHWPWLLLLAGSLAVAAFVVGFLRQGAVAVARVSFGRAPLASGLGLKPAEPPGDFAERLEAELRSSAFLDRLAATAGALATVESLRNRMSLRLDAASGALTLEVRDESAWKAGRLAQSAADLALRAAADLWRADLQSRQDSIGRQLAAAEEGLNRLKTEISSFQQSNDVYDARREFASALERKAALESKGVTLRTQIEANQARMVLLSEETRRNNPAITGAREALYQALTRYTDEHPKVRALRASLEQMEAGLTNNTIASLEAGAGASTNSVQAGLQWQLIELKAQNAALEKEMAGIQAALAPLARRLSDLAGKDPEFARLQAGYQSLQECRDALLKQRHEAMLEASRGPGEQRLIHPARADVLPLATRLARGARWGGVGAAAGGALGFLALALVGPSGRIRSREDMEECTGLPVLASLGDLENLDRKERETWAFETLSILKANIRQSGGKALICGFISSAPQEGKSTWIKLLAAAARKQGYCVAIVSNKRGRSRGRTAGPPTESQDAAAPADQQAALLPTAPLAQAPGRVLADPSQFPLRIGLADWIWNWEYRDQFEQALRNWSMIDNLAVLVELPPYSTPEGVMMAEKLPNLVWLSNAETAQVARIGAQVASLRRSHPGLMGAVLNRVERAAASAVPLALLCLGLAGFSRSALAADPVAPPEVAKAPRILSITSPDQMASWQKKLTLGPGDVLDVSLYGQPDSSRPGLIIGPDGRLNYLQARDVMAAGLTVDELRAELEKVLAKYQLAPQVVINPVAYRSKRYFLLGSVNARGVYTLDRPTTIIEAVAKGRGFMSVIQQQNPIAMVDLSRSFLVRKGEAGDAARVPVDFEALFLRGDLSQNLALQPDDYLFFPTLAVQEVYVVGEVRSQGVVPLNREMTALGAVIARGGFTERAWKSKILVVRGSMINPELLPVNAAEILKAKGTDLKLNNRDIVYVHMKPWAKAQELLEGAIYSFAQAVAMGYVNQNIIPYNSASFGR